MFGLHNLKRNMATTPKVVLLACGSFNPVTNMHLRMFELGRDALNRTGRFTVVGGIISPVNDAYKKKDLASAKHRCSMLREALKNTDWIKLDTWESEQTKWLETAKVLSHHRAVLDSQFNANVKATHTKRRRKIHPNDDEIYNGNHDGEAPPLLKLLCGADLLESFGTPGLWADEDIEAIVGKHGLVCITRAGSNPQRFIYDSDVLTKYKENITIVTEWMTNEISATKVRRALRRGESVKYLLPDPVIEYIQKHQLYGVPDNKDINHLMPSPDGEDMPLDIEDELSSSSSVEFDISYRSSAGSRSSTSMDISSPELPIERSPVRQAVTRGRQVACMTDIGTLMRRVKNYNLRLFQSNTAQQ